MRLRVLCGEVRGSGTSSGGMGRSGVGAGGQALPSPVVRIGQLEPWPGQLDVLLADHEGEDLLV